jgi:hypothetical protein
MKWTTSESAAAMSCQQTNVSAMARILCPSADDVIDFGMVGPDVMFVVQFVPVFTWRGLAASLIERVVCPIRTDKIEAIAYR